MGTPDKRAHERLLCAGLVEVRWSDKDGYPCETIANLENLSSGGACLSIDCPIPPGTRVAVGHLISQVEAEIRHCTGSDLGWVIGVQFLTGKTPGAKACQPSHAVDPRAVTGCAPFRDGLRLARAARSTVECLALYEAVRDLDNCHAAAAGRWRDSAD